MGLFSKLFGKKENANLPIEYINAIACNKEFDSLLSEDKFIARSDYKHILEQYKDIYIFFESTRKANTLSYYCKQNRLQETEIKKFLLYYEDIKDLEKGSALFTEHNDAFVKNHLQSEKSYLDKILYEVDSKILLDEEQRKVILSDEDYTLIIAGAGAGKTTTVAAKVRYLVEKK
ncbi:MAG: UvrD-helicase domain-containing protein, partial [Bacilli bacterium]|nr:UvrD-helicase domain-containing protein [Bacilli bacterium]